MTATEWLMFAAHYEREAALCEVAGDTLGSAINGLTAHNCRACASIVERANARPQ